MKFPIRFILSIFSITAGSLAGFCQPLTITPIEAYGIASFPFFTGGKPGVAERINLYLQMNELQTVSLQGKKTILKQYDPSIEDNAIVPANAHISYEVRWQNKNFISLSVYSDGVAAYEWSQNHFYLFNTGNGELLKTNDIFTNNAMNKMAGIICKAEYDSMEAKKKWIMKEVVTEEKESILELVNGCQRSCDGVGAGYLIGMKMIIDSGKVNFGSDLCLPHVYGYYEPSGGGSNVSFDIKPGNILEFTDLGKTLFFDTIPEVSQIHSASTDQVFKCELEDQTIFYFSIRNVENEYSYGHMYLPKTGKVCSLSGHCKDGVTIIDVLDDSNKMKGNFILYIKENQITGTYTFKDPERIVGFSGKVF